MSELYIGKKERGGTFSIPTDFVTQTCAIIAKRGVGKTVTASVLCEEMLERNFQCVIIDPLDCWFGLRSSANGKESGFPIVVIGGEHGDLQLTENSGEIIADFIVDHGISAVLSLRHLSNNAARQFVTVFCERLYDRKGESKNKTPLHLVIDEADAYIPQRLFHGAERCFGAVDRIVRRGRSSGIGVTMISQRSAAINKDCLTQAEVLVALRTISPQDRKAIEAWIEAHDANDQHKVFMESLASLPVGTAWFWSPGWLDLFDKVHVRMRHTFDSSATPKVGKRVMAPKKLADVDIQGLKSKLASTIESKKADDPKLLRQRISELEHQLKQKPAAAPKVKTQVVEKRVVSKSDITRLSKASKLVSDKAEKMSGLSHSLKLYSELWNDVAKRLLAQLDEIEKKAAPFTPPTRQEFKTAIGRDFRLAEQPIEQPIATNGSARISRGETAILTACAQYNRGLRREQLTTITGYARSSRDTYIHRLRQRGYLSQDGDNLVASETGVAALGDFTPLPTGKYLRDHYMTTLPLGERNILNHVLQAYPEEISRERLGELTGYARSSRDTYLHRMSNKEIVEVTRDGVKASPNLF